MVLQQLAKPCLCVDWQSIPPSLEGMTAPNHPQLIGSIEARLPEALDWLRQMVDINSFTTNRAGVNAVGKVTADCFSELGFKPDFVPSENPAHGDHLFLEQGDPRLEPIVLVTHLDTVFPPEEEIQNGFHWSESHSEGRIYGPGTVDIKGGTMLIWMLLRALQQHHPEMFALNRWIVAANASEEVIGAEFGRRTAERATDGARAVLVFEGGPRREDHYHVVSSRKGRALYRIHAEGRSAHAGSSHAAGANAIVSIAGAVQAAACVTDYSRDLTVNVGRIGGGTVVNRVPQEAWDDLEMRAYEPLVLAEAQARIESLAAMPASQSEARLRVECTGTSPAWPQHAQTLMLLKHWRDAGQTLGVTVKNVSRGGLSDANYLCVLGPTLDGLGPSGANAHCSERTHDGSKIPEYVEPGSFAPKTAMNMLALVSYLKTQAS
jgi:glutamate carboxypeptidase